MADSSLSDRDDSLKEKLLRDIDDLDMTVRKLVETVIIRKESRSAVDIESGVRNLVDLVAVKGNDLKTHLISVSGQIERRNAILTLQEELHQRDLYIEKLQNCLKEAETGLISAVFQANQKLKSVSQANHRKVDPEELIKFAHKISKTNAVAAPPTWQQGNPERPFPTESEMQKGWLGSRNLSSGPPTAAVLPEGSMFPPAPPTSGAHFHLQSALMGNRGGGFAHPAHSPRASGVTPPFQGVPPMAARQTSPYGSGIPGTPPLGGFNMSPQRFPQGGVGSPGQSGAMVPPPPPYSRSWGPQRFSSQMQQPGGPMPTHQAGGYGPNSPRAGRPSPYPVPPTAGRHVSPAMQPPASPRGIPSGFAQPPGYPQGVSGQQLTNQQQAAMAQLRQRRPSTGTSPRLATPPSTTAHSKQRTNDVDTMSSDSSSSSSSGSPN